MKRTCTALILALLGATSAFAGTQSPPPEGAPCVALLHGLARTDKSMWRMSYALSTAGYEVHNISYPSTSGVIEDLADAAIAPVLSSCDAPVHFVTHSMGGILLRSWVSRHGVDGIGRAVMLGPPNQGSDLVDTLEPIPGFAMLNGPAGLQLGKGENSLPRALGAYPAEVGIIAGTRSLNPIYSAMLDGPDDGKVSVQDTHMDGETDWISIETTHTFMMMRDAVIDETLHFLESGAFTSTP